MCERMAKLSWAMVNVLRYIGEVVWMCIGSVNSFLGR